MCLICLDLEKDKLTLSEGWRNLQEMKSSMTDEHYDEVIQLMIDKLAENNIEAEDEEELASILEENTLSDLMESFDNLQLSFDWDYNFNSLEIEQKSSDSYEDEVYPWRNGNDIY